MRSIISLLTATSLASVAVAGPVPEAQAQKGSYVIQQSASTSKKPLSGPQALAAAYSKYNKPVPANVADAAHPFNVNAGTTGTDPASPEQYDRSYLCPVSVGGKTLNLDFDTGSADLWVFSSELPSSERSGHDYYTTSHGTKASGYTWKISYGDGSSASGDVYYDTVAVAAVTVTSQAVEAAQTISSEFQQDTDNDGLLGLAFSTINTVKPQSQKTFFDMAIAEGKLAQNLFAVDLKYHATGSYEFGGTDSSKYTGSFTYSTIDSSQGFWTFKSTGYGVGSTFHSTSLSGIADTGTTLLLLPDSVVDTYYNSVSGAYYDDNQGGYLFPCSTTPPNFVVGVGSARYTIPGKYINFAPVDSTYCYGGLQSSSGIGINIYGDIFLKAVYAVFDKTQSSPRIGFASKST